MFLSLWNLSREKLFQGTRPSVIFLKDTFVSKTPSETLFLRPSWGYFSRWNRFKIDHLTTRRLPVLLGSISSEAASPGPLLRGRFSGVASLRAISPNFFGPHRRTASSGSSPLGSLPLGSLPQGLFPGPLPGPLPRASPPVWRSAQANAT